MLKCFAGFKTQGKLMWSGNQSIQTIEHIDFHAEKHWQLIQDLAHSLKAADNAKGNTHFQKLA